MLKTAILVGLLAAILVPPILVPPIWTIVFTMGWGRHYYKQHPGKCSVIKKMGTGSEDFQILTSGMTFITSGVLSHEDSIDFKKYVKSKGKGSIQHLDMNDPSSGAKEVPIKHSSHFNMDTFRPHGLSVLEDKVKDEHLVYVINHVEGQADRVEKFRYSPKTKDLKHEMSIFSEAFGVTNDLSVIEEDKFYIGKWLYFADRQMTLIEHLYRMPLGGVVFYNGSDGRVIKDRMFTPNGNILSKDKRFFYLSLFYEEKIQVYKRKPDYDLELVQEVMVHTAVDNFHLSENGDSLFVGCHPIIHKAVNHFSTPADVKAPSQVLRLPLKDGLIVEGDITQEFYDEGNLVSGSSVAGVYDNKMLIGSVVHTLVICDLPKEQ